MEHPVRSFLVSLVWAAALPSLTSCLTPKVASDTPSVEGGSTTSRARYSSGGGSGSSQANGSSSTGSQATQGSAASNGSGAGSGGGNDASSPPMRGPTPAMSGHNFPFPQNRQASGFVYPTGYLNSDVQNAYNLWKTDLVTSDNADGHQRVQRTSSDGQDTCRPLNSTVSEGIGYGMLIAVYMDDQDLFDDLWLYEQGHLDSSGLMNWAPNGTDPNMCNGAATDADEDMAFALVMADKQWGGQGKLSQSYQQSAVGQIQKIWGSEIFNYTYVRAGDGTWATNTNQNISYYAPAYYRVFAAVDPKACPKGMGHSDSCDGWWDVIDQSYATIGDALNSANGNQSNGLVPGWCDDSQGAPCRGSSGQPFNYQYDACRTPFRVGLDACWNGYGAAQDYVGKTSSFFVPIGASSIVDGYGLDGTPQPANSGKLSAAFIGPATVGAMGNSANQAFVDQGYAVLAQDDAFAGGEYYESCWTVMSLLMLTGNFLDYTQETPAQ